MKYKIAYCIPSLYRSGGIESVLTTKVNYLAENFGYDIYLILTDGKNKKPYYDLSDKIHIIQLNINFEKLWQCPFYRKIIIYLFKQIKYKKKLKKILLNIRPDITVSLLRREINFINSIHDGSKKIGELHFNKNNYRNFNKKYLPHFLNCYITKEWQKKLIDEIKKLDKFIVLTQEDKKTWTELDNIQVIPNPIKYYPKESSTCLNKKVIAVGRYTWQKGFDMLINSWNIVHEKHPDWQLNIYGGGNYKAYQELVNKKNLHLSIICHQATKNIYEKYIDSSIFVLSSRYEGFGLVLTESMSCGLPVVSFACPCGPKDIIKDREDGFLVENGNVEQLADKICYLIEYENERISMGKKAKENVKRFDKEKIMQQWIDLFNELTKKEE